MISTRAGNLNFRPIAPYIKGQYHQVKTYLFCFSFLVNPGHRHLPWHSTAWPKACRLYGAAGRALHFRGQVRKIWHGRGLVSILGLSHEFFNSFCFLFGLGNLNKGDYTQL